MSALIDPRSQARISASIATHSRSFSLAASLLPAGVRDEARVLYAYCRRADDAIDLVPPAEQARALVALRAELDDLYRSRAVVDETVRAFGAIVYARAIPRAYPEALLAGMEMDATGFVYESWSDLLRYCYRVAGTVGLMMCHVMGVRREGALLHAAHLGIAMQLTNIARDVREDWVRGRLYLPLELLDACGVSGLAIPPVGGLPDAAAEPLARATQCLLERADGYYRSADAGLRDLSPRCAFGVRAARSIYAAIGDELRKNGCDPRAPRAVVASRDKAALTLRAAYATLAALPAAVRADAPCRVPRARIDEAAAAIGALP